jgi:hypothetical protein
MAKPLSEHGLAEVIESSPRKSGLDVQIPSNVNQSLRVTLPCSTDDTLAGKKEALAWFLSGVIISMFAREFDRIGCILLFTSDQSFVLNEKVDL